MRHRLRVFRARTLAWIGFARLLVAVARRRVDEVWIGDSNSVLMVRDSFPALGVGPAGERSWVWHLGPRLMFSIARDGFPPGMHSALRILRRVPGSSDVTCFFSLGEIDLRCHLAPRFKEHADLSFVPTYLDRIRSLTDDLGATRAVVVVPVPPAVETLLAEGFPIEGTVEDRLAAHRAVRALLLAETQQDGAGAGIDALDLTDVLSEPTGYFRADLTYDGVHPNDAGRAVIRQGVTALQQSA